MGFLGLEIALSGLRTQQQAMNVTGHNIANASTKGYHRQEAAMIPGNPLTGALAMTGVGSPQLGTGSMVYAVRRMQSEYIDQQVRTAHNYLGNWEYRKEQLAQVESAFAEPGDLGISASMNRFWSSWEELASSPESQSAKISVVENGVALSQRITTLYQDLRNMQSRTDQDIVDNAAQINRLALEIAKINQQIKRSEANGYQPNDLLDHRDTLIDELSSIVNIQVSGAVGADIILAISGRPLVQGDLVKEIEVTQDAEGWSQLQWASDGAPVRVTGGQLAGQFQGRDEVIQGYLDSLNTLAATLVEQVNAVYSTGVTSSGAPAGNFFVAGSDASNITVEAGLVANPAAVVTARTTGPGANDLARDIAKLSSQKLADGESIGDGYLRLVARVGAQSREAISREETYTLMLHQLDTQRESISGVSLDEEMLNMAKFQQAYGAAARVATTMDEMIETMISRVGIVGR